MANNFNISGDLNVSGNTNILGNLILSGLSATTISANTYQNLPFSGTVTGIGTLNYIPKFTGTTALGSSLIYDDGTNVGIGTSSPLAKVDINVSTGGTLGVRISGNSSSDMLRITQTGLGNAILVEDSANPDSTPFVVAPDGKIGLGTTSPNYFMEAVSTGGVDAVMLFDGGTAANANLVARADTTQKLPVVVMSDRNNAYGVNTSFYIGLDRSPSSQYAGRNDSIYVNNYTDKGHYFVTTNSGGTKSVKMSILGNGTTRIDGVLTVVTGLTVSGVTTLFSTNTPPTPTISTPFIDDYNRVTLSPGGTPSLTYTNTNTGTGNATIVTNYLNIANGAVAGQSYTTVPLSGFSSPFNPTLSSNNPLSTIEWTFNLRTNRASIFSGFLAGSYGGAVVLAGSNTNIQTSGTGYALVYGTTASRNWKLIKYNNGLAGTQTDVIAGGTFSSNTSYVSARIVYTPSTNTWTYYFRDDGTVAWGDPTTVTTLIGSAVDSTYTSTLMSVFGVFFNYSTAANQNLQFDNLRVQQTITPLVTPTDELIVKNYSNSDVFKLKDDGSITTSGNISTSGSVTSSSGFFGSFSGTHLGNGSDLILGQSGVMITGSTSLTVTSTTTALTLVPGLTTTITVGSQTMVYIQTNGGVNTTATTGTGGSALDFAIVVDGAVLPAGGYQRMYADNPTANATVTNWVANWNMAVVLTLSAGSHTVQVQTVYVAGSTATVSGGAGTIKQGTLSIMVLKNI